MWAQLLIAIAFMVFLYFFFTWLARVTSPPRIVVSVARVAVDARARRFVQGRLDELAKTADTRSTKGLSALLRAACNALIASRLAWIYVSAQTRTPETPELAREHHKRITDDARARFRHELVRHAEGKKTVEDAIEKLREALKGSDIDAIKAGYDDLQAKFQEVSAELYKQAAAQAGPAPEAGAQAGTPPPKKDSDVVDAEFEMVDEDKKK
jgi:hypothetical protein